MIQRRMIHRRLLLAAGLAVPALAALPRASRAAEPFESFVAGVRAQALREGISARTLDRAFAGVHPNAKVLELINHQPEFTLTWAEYRAKVVNENRIAIGRQAFARDRATLEAVRARYGVDPGVIMGIWGLESNFGATKGTYNVIEALATLAWGSHRAAFFRGELIAALRILDAGDITPERMLGSFAGAMGQPQFMPSSYLRLAVDFDGGGRRDIWDNRADTLGSIGNYLARSGWTAGLPWGQPVRVPPGFDAAATGRDRMRQLSAWMAAGVRRADGSAFLRPEASGAVLMPDGAGGEAFMVYGNFAAIRRYNASDFYALAVGLIGDRILA
jgi:membrane-bound lytic murein transglycosylase B